jgi:hypothetical protein
MAGFESIVATLNSLIKRIDDKYEHHDAVLDEHDRRLSDVERWIAT